MNKLDLVKREPLAIVLFLLAGVLIFANLGSVSLWEDEAETALVAKTIWTHGIPKISDGVNYFYQEQGKRVGFGDIWAWTPWLQFYLTSLSLKVFGENEFAARFPFALAGWLSLFLLFWIAKRLFDSTTASISLLLATWSVPLLVYMRQCRYYSLIVFFNLLAVYGLLKVKEGNRLGTACLFLSLFLLFHANYISWFPLLLTMLFFSFVWRVSTTVRRRTQRVLFATALINAPWFFLFKPLHEKTRVFDFGIFLDSVFFFFEGINHYVVPFLLVVLLGIGLKVLSPWKSGEGELSVEQKHWVLFFAVLILTTIAFALFGPAKVFRYLVGVIPILHLLLALLLSRLWKRKQWLGGLTVGVLLCSNLFHVAFYPFFRMGPPMVARHFKGRFEFPLVSYLGELISPPQGATRAIVSYLRGRAAPDDLVLATYGNLPIMFYTGLRVIGGLSREALDEAKEAKWVIPRKVLISDDDGRVMVYLLDRLPWDRYERIDLDETDFPWDYIPEPQVHRFRDVSFNVEWRIQLYRKLDEKEPSQVPKPPELFYVIPMERAISGASAFRHEFIEYLLWLKNRSAKPS